MLRGLVVGIVAILSCSPALARQPVPCETMLGDLWGERPVLPDVKTIDGTLVTSPAQLAQMVGKGAIVQGGDFSEWDFRRMTLGAACFVESNLKGSVWNGASAAGIGFIKTDLSESTLTGMHAPGVLFRDANLTNVKADMADFSEGMLEGGWFDGSIDGWNLDGTNLSRFVFSCGITLSDGCPLRGNDAPILARGANLTGAALSSFRRYGLDGIDLEGAVLDRTEVSPGQLASFRGRMIVHPLVLVGGDSRIELSAAEVQALIDDAAIVASQASGPAFDCAKAASAVEKALCHPDAADLAQADRELGALFIALRKARPTIVADQRQWLKTRDSCMTKEYPSDCLRTVYADRQSILLGMLGERNWLAPGSAALFIDDELPLSDSMRATSLFGRIAPLLAKASMGYVHVARSADGSYVASGESVGANAHLCSLGAGGLRLDPANGWYSVLDPASQRRVRIFQMRGDWLTVFASGRPTGDEAEAGADYVSCGARAAFGPMRRIALPDTVLESYANRAGMEH